MIIILYGICLRLFFAKNCSQIIIKKVSINFVYTAYTSIYRYMGTETLDFHKVREALMSLAQGTEVVKAGLG